MGPQTESLRLRQVIRDWQENPDPESTTANTTTTYTYDGANWVTGYTDHDGTLASGVVSTYGYDVDGRLESLRHAKVQDLFHVGYG